jgi:hypothetical protein
MAVLILVRLVTVCHSYEETAMATKVRQNALETNGVGSVTSSVCHADSYFNQDYKCELVFVDIDEVEHYNMIFVFNGKFRPLQFHLD